MVSTTIPTIWGVGITIVVGYLIGSVPIANLVARRQASVDLRAVGDRNPGYWNAKEVLGGRAALPVLIGDIGKGVAAALVGVGVADSDVWAMAYVGTGAAMVGHAFPVFAGFRGGRSVLAFVGGAAVFAPLAVAVGIGAMLVMFAATTSFAVAARAGFVVLPLAQLAIQGPYRTAATGVLMTFIGVRFLTTRLVDGPQFASRR